MFFVWQQDEGCSLKICRWFICGSRASLTASLTDIVSVSKSWTCWRIAVHSTANLQNWKQNMKMLVSLVRSCVTAGCKVVEGLEDVPSLFNLLLQCWSHLESHHFATLLGYNPALCKGPSLKGKSLEGWYHPGSCWFFTFRMGELIQQRSMQAGRRSWCCFPACWGSWGC